MTLVVFTPTYRPGGLDVLEASLMRQTHRDFVWVVSDQLFLDRKVAWAKVLDRIDFPLLWMNREVIEGNKRNLAAMYNAAVDYVLSDGFEMLVSLQDYIYLPEDGLEKFISANKVFPDSLLTGVTHISRDPYPNKVVDPEGDYTIFAEPYYDKPKRMSWDDVRATELYVVGPELLPVEQTHWEANWAAVPRKILETGIRWDEQYDKGIAYENMDFAMQAKEKGFDVVLDKSNVAISLPHKDYFDGEREEIVEFSNRELYESKWMQ
jgi:hypothetical protein